MRRQASEHIHARTLIPCASSANKRCKPSENSSNAFSDESPSADTPGPVSWDVFWMYLPLWAPVDDPRFPERGSKTNFLSEAVDRGSDPESGERVSFPSQQDSSLELIRIKHGLMWFMCVSEWERVRMETEEETNKSSEEGHRKRGYHEGRTKSKGLCLCLLPWRRLSNTTQCRKVQMKGFSRNLRFGSRLRSI